VAFSENKLVLCNSQLHVHNELIRLICCYTPHMTCRMLSKLFGVAASHYCVLETIGFSSSERHLSKSVHFRIVLHDVFSSTNFTQYHNSIPESVNSIDGLPFHDRRVIVLSIFDVVIDASVDWFPCTGLLIFDQLTITESGARTLHSTGAKVAWYESAA
jgi:hypothetical protein